MRSPFLPAALLATTALASPALLAPSASAEPSAANFGSWVSKLVQQSAGAGSESSVSVQQISTGGSSSVSVVSTGESRCITGSGRLVTKDVAGSFSRVRVSSPFRVSIAAGQRPHLRLRVDDNVLNRVSVEVSGGTLRLGLKPGTCLNNATLRGTITLPRLTDLRADGASSIRLNRLRVPGSLTASLAGSSTLAGQLDARTLALRASGASDAQLAGRGDVLSASGAGASTLNLRAYRVKRATVTLRGASHGTVSAADSLSADLSGASSLGYLGRPKVTQRVTDVSRLYRID